MNQQTADASPLPGAVAGEPRLLWAAAASVAGFGSWMLYDALPGLNWFLWTAAAATGLMLFVRARGSASQPASLMGGAAIVVSGAAAVTSSEGLTALVCLAVMFLLAMQMSLSTGVALRVVTLSYAAIAPIIAFKDAIVHSARRAAVATRIVRSDQARARVRGIAITLPVLLVFALLLAGADPVFAAWRDAIGRFVADWEFVPRVVFFTILLVIVLGAYSHASVGTADSPALTLAVPERWLGSTERLMLLASVAALFWLFLAVQLGYLFGNLPQTPASGVTFAEYARRGFGELTAVASASALLIIVSERYGNDDGRERTLRVLTFAVIAAVLLLLASAFRRVWLYEEAYGFTTARLYAQVYMCAVAVGLVMLSLEVAGDFDAGRVFRRATAPVVMMFIALVYWNHEAWIANRNIDRFASAGQLDVAYLTKELSPDAIPAIVKRLPALPEPIRAEMLHNMRTRFEANSRRRERRWFEWNLSSTRAERALNGAVEQP